MTRKAQTTAAVLLVIAYTSLMAYGVYLRLPGLDPSSFWNDDSWLAIAIRQMSWGDFLRLRPPIPVGFRAIQAIASRVAADPEWPLQLIPLAASILQALFAGLVASRICNDRWVGLVAAAWALVSPAWTELGVRPKQYATDALTTVVLFLLAMRMWQLPSRARVVGFLASCVGALAVSFSAVFTVSSALGATLLLPAARRALLGRGERPALLIALLACLALVLFMKSQSGGSLYAYWSAKSAFMPTDSVTASLGFLRRFVWNFAIGGFPEPLAFLVFGVGLGLLMATRSAIGRSALVLIGGIFAGLVVSSALALYPLQSGRLSAFHRPLGPILLAVGIHGCVRWLPRSARSSVFLVAAIAALPFAEHSAYPSVQDADVVRAANQQIRPTDTVITFMRSAHPLAYYTPGDHEMVREPRLGSGFIARLKRPRTFYLWLGPGDDLQALERIDAQLAVALGSATDRIVLVPPLQTGRRGIRSRTSYIVSRILDSGYARSVEAGNENPFVVVLERRESL